jgi:hypothetical protein
MCYAGTVLGQEQVQEQVAQHVSGLPFKSDEHGNIHSAFGKACIVFFFEFKSLSSSASWLFDSNVFSISIRM